MSANGRLLTCLFASRGLDTCAPMRNSHTDEEVRQLVANQWMRRADRYSEQRGEISATDNRSKVEMSFIGG
ncbi:GTP 3',8-cyclase MoaA family protein [Paraburkholderia strydomiana]|uniref:hypothetical protein n=1 Tax=Paraburkholderia strydomiana TaxID=1245417 RepID=UPI0038B7E58B